MGRREKSEKRERFLVCSDDKNNSRWMNDKFQVFPKVLVQIVSTNSTVALVLHIQHAYSELCRPSHNMPNDTHTAEILLSLKAFCSSRDTMA